MRLHKQVTGLTETKANLRALPDAIAEIWGTYIEDWADDVFTETLSRVPRDTGELANSYGKNIRSDRLQAAVGSDLYRAAFAELGTKRQRARPHLYPAFRKANRRFRARVRDTVEDLGKVRTRVKRLRKPRKTA